MTWAPDYNDTTMWVTAESETDIGVFKLFLGRLAIEDLTNKAERH